MNRSGSNQKEIGNVKKKKVIFEKKEDPLLSIENSLIELQQLLDSHHLKERTIFRYFYNIRYFLMSKETTYRKSIISLIFKSHYFYIFISNISILTNNECTELTLLFTYFIHFNIGKCVGDYMMSDEGLKILHILVHQYSNLNKSLYCGSMLRECLHYKNLSLLFLNNSKLLNHFIYVYPSSECRELRIDVMYTIRVLLLSNTDSWEKKHFQIVAFALQSFIQLFSSEYSSMQKLCMDLLYDFLLLPSIHISYFLDSLPLLQIVFQDLISSDSVLQNKSFLVFRLFTLKSNPSKSIHRFLHLNKQQLINTCSKLKPDDSYNTDVFLNEKKRVLFFLHNLHPPPK